MTHEELVCKWDAGVERFHRRVGMAYSIKKHEVDRLLNVLIVLGWELKEERYENSGITLVIHKTLSADLLKAAGELDKPSSPQ